MKRQLLMSAAIVATLAGTDFALAQAQPDMNRNAPGLQGNAPGSPNAPAEKIAPPGDKGPGPAAAEQKAPPANRGAQSTIKAAPGSADADTKIDNKSDARTRDDATRAQDDPKADSQSGSNAQTRQPASRTDINASLTAEQRTRIHEVVVKQPSAPRVAHVDFSLNVGAVVPSRVRVVALPPTIVEIHPAWRGYMYFLVGDEIVIVEPGTMRIVEILPA